MVQAVGQLSDALPMMTGRLRRLSLPALTRSANAAASPGPNTALASLYVYPRDASVRPAVIKAGMPSIPISDYAGQFANVEASPLPSGRQWLRTLSGIREGHDVSFPVVGLAESVRAEMPNTILVCCREAAVI